MVVDRWWEKCVALDLEEALPRLRSNDGALTRLSLEGEKIGAAGARELAGALRENTALADLSLMECGIDAEGAGALADALRENASLARLHLGINEIGAEGARALADALKENAALVHLVLYDNDIGDEGARALADTFRGNAALAHLDLGRNEIGDEGARALADGLKQSTNTTLTRLALEYNGIGHEAGHAEGDICGWTSRNILLQLHKDGVQKEGFDFYFGKNGDGGSGTDSLRVEETVWVAAATGDGLVLGLVQDVLKKHLDGYSGDALKSEKESLKALFDGARSPEGSPLLHRAAALDSEEALNLCKFLVDEIGVDFDAATDRAGRTARDVAQGNANARTGRWAKSVGTFLGRYLIEERAKYKSATCEVHFGVDVEKPRGHPDRDVAIKVMQVPEQFKREINKRLRENSRPSSGADVEEGSNRFHENHVVPLLCYHETEFKGHFYMCLVMPKGERNVDEVLRYEGIAGQEINAITFFAVDMAEALKHLSDNGLIHGDFKPMNIVRIHGDYKLIDFDASIGIGGILTKKFSTAYLPPEKAKVIFRPEESEDHLLETKEQLEEDKKKVIADNDDDALAAILAELKEVKKKIEQMNSLTSATPEEKPRANAQMDIWSYGVVMYQMLTGRTLFDCDVNGNLLNDQAKNKLLNWTGISEEDLSHVLVNCQDQDLVESAKELLRKCLSPEERRPKSFNQVLALPFLKRENALSQKIKEGMDRIEVKIDARFDLVEENLKQIALKLDKALDHFQAHFNMLEKLLHSGPNKLAPKFICFLPEEAATSGKNWLHSVKTFNASTIFSKSVRIFFVDPIRMNIAPTNNGDGFKLKVPKDWVIQAMPYVKLSLTALKVAYSAGRLSGFPVPDVKGLVGNWIDGQLGELEAFADESKELLSEWTSDPEAAKRLLDEMDSNAREAIAENIGAMMLVDDETLSKKIDEPIKRSFDEFDRLLSEHGNWREKCGLVLTTSGDGTSEYILREDIEEFKYKGASMLSGSASNEPSEPEPYTNLPQDSEQATQSPGSQLGPLCESPSQPGPNVNVLRGPPPSASAAGCCVIA